MTAGPALSFVVPLYNAAGTIRPLFAEIAALVVEGGHELVLVNDGSSDATGDICRSLLADSDLPVTYVEHTRNFGEHNAVLTGWRHARGTYVVNVDDDGQNPPAEALRLYHYAVDNGLDAAFGHYAEKRHALWRNWGSRMSNRITDVLLDKPRGFYLSSFRCVSAAVAREVATNSGPYPYIDGLILQVTQRIGGLEVEHSERSTGRSGYTMRRLLRLWLSTVVNFSVMPLRLATVLGLVMSVLGFAGIAIVLYWRLTNRGPAFGWGSLMSALLLFSGVQLALLGVIGEYLGRTFITINQRPQSVVRDVARSVPALSSLQESRTPAIGGIRSRSRG
jgi:undecaprenyl-phosphate 4-deoxy-4-formamido-L-arabinose transferase